MIFFFIISFRVFTSHEQADAASERVQKTSSILQNIMSETNDNLGKIAETTKISQDIISAKPTTNKKSSCLLSINGFKTNDFCELMNQDITTNAMSIYNKPISGNIDHANIRFHNLNIFNCKFFDDKGLFIFLYLNVLLTNINWTKNNVIGILYLFQCNLVISSNFFIENILINDLIFSSTVLKNSIENSKFENNIFSWPQQGRILNLDSSKTICKKQGPIGRVQNTTVEYSYLYIMKKRPKIGNAYNFLVFEGCSTLFNKLFLNLSLINSDEKYTVFFHMHPSVIFEDCCFFINLQNSQFFLYRQINQKKVTDEMEKNHFKGSNFFSFDRAFLYQSKTVINLNNLYFNQNSCSLDNKIKEENITDIGIIDRFKRNQNTLDQRNFSKKKQKINKIGNLIIDHNESMNDSNGEKRLDPEKKSNKYDQTNLEIKKLIENENSKVKGENKDNSHWDNIDLFYLIIFLAMATIILFAFGFILYQIIIKKVFEDRNIKVLFIGSSGEFSTIEEILNEKNRKTGLNANNDHCQNSDNEILESTPLEERFFADIINGYSDPENSGIKEKIDSNINESPSNKK